MAEAYGVLTDDGKYARRHTFYIGPDGKLLDIDREVNPMTAAADVLVRLENLGVPGKDM